MTLFLSLLCAGAICYFFNHSLMEYLNFLVISRQNICLCVAETVLSYEHGQMYNSSLFPSSAWSRPDSTTSRSSTSRMTRAQIMWRLGWVYSWKYALIHNIMNLIYGVVRSEVPERSIFHFLAVLLLFYSSLLMNRKHDIRLTLNPANTLSFSSTSVSISTLTPTAFLKNYFSIDFLRIYSVILFYFIFTFYTPLRFSLRVGVSHFWGSSEMTGVQFWSFSSTKVGCEQDRQYIETSGECM